MTYSRVAYSQKKVSRFLMRNLLASNLLTKKVSRLLASNLLTSTRTGLMCMMLHAYVDYVLARRKKLDFDYDNLSEKLEEAFAFLW